MRSRQVSFRIQPELYEEMDRLCKRRGYRNLSRFFWAQAVMAVQDSRRTAWLLQLANAKPKEQDELVHKMLKWPLSLKGMVEMTRKLDN
jgi:hypothetical protein